MEYYIYVLIVALTITSVGALLTLGLVLWWLYDNFPFKYIKLDNSFVADIKSNLGPFSYKQLRLSPL